MNEIDLNVGDVYWDCAYHPVKCTEIDDDDVSGISLLDKSSPRYCSIKNCGVIKLNQEQTDFLVSIGDEIIKAHEAFQDNWDVSVYGSVFDKIKDSKLFN